MQNASGIHPTEFNVLVRVEEVAQTTKGGIILPDDHRDLKQAIAMKASLIECSPLAFGYDVWPEGSAKPAPGDRVVISKQSGVAVEGEDGEKYRLIKDKDVLAVLQASQSQGEQHERHAA